MGNTIRGIGRVVEFAITCKWFKVRDVFSPPDDLLRECGVAAGARVLDYGCGPGSYTFAAARMVGERGHMYAVDFG